MPSKPMQESRGHLDGFVAASGDVGDGLAELKAGVRIKVLALRNTRVRSVIIPSAHCREATE